MDYTVFVLFELGYAALLAWEKEVSTGIIHKTHGFPLKPTEGLGHEPSWVELLRLKTQVSFYSLH